MKMRIHLGLDGKDQESRCKSASVYTVRDFCDGQSLASPGRWSPSERRYPQSEAWNAVVGSVKRFSEVFGTTKHLMDLALGRIKE